MSLYLKSVEYGSITNDNNSDINNNNNNINMEINDDNNDEINYEANKTNKLSTLSSLLKSLTTLTSQDYTIIANTSNALLGVSIFAIPWGFSQSGMLGGAIILSIVASLAFETARILLLSQCILYSKSGIINTYPEIAANVLGKSWYYVVQTATAISCLGGCVGYLIFLGEISAQLLQLSFNGSVIILCIPLVLLSWIRQFKELTIFTVLGVVSVCIAIAAILVDGFRQDDLPYDVVTFRPRTSLNFFGPATFLYTIHYCVLSMGTEALRDAEAKNKNYISLVSSSSSSSTPPFSNKNNKLGQISTSSFTKPLAISYFVSTSLIGTLGAFGYLFFSMVPFPLTVNNTIVPGCEEHVCQNIIINLSPGPTKVVVSIALIIAISLGYIIVLAPAREHIETAILSIRCSNDYINTALLKNIIRTSIVLSTAIVAIATPYFGSILGLVGGLTDALQSFVLPPLIYLKLSGNSISNTRNIFYRIVIVWGSCTILYTVTKISVAILLYLSYLYIK